MATKRKVTQQDVDNDAVGVAAMADRMKLTGDQRDHYIHEHMTKLGHTAHRAYGPSDSYDDDDGSGGKKKDDDSGFF
jgi:hypothetical protein